MNQPSDGPDDVLRTQWFALCTRAHKHLERPGEQTTTQLGTLVELYEQVREATADRLADSTRPDDGVFELDGERLRGWFCVQVLRSQAFAERCRVREPDAAAAAERSRDTRGQLRPLRALELLHYASVYVLERLHHLRERDALGAGANRGVGDEELDEVEPMPFADAVDHVSRGALVAELAVIAEFARAEVGVAPQIPLTELLLEFIPSQLLLYGADHAYRDHLFHVIDVCLFGHFLLTECKLSEVLADHMPPFPSARGPRVVGTPPTPRERLLRNWFVAGLLHDLGRSLDVLRVSRVPLSLPGHSERLGKAVTEVQDVVTRWGKDVAQETIIWAGAPAPPDEDEAAWPNHGVVSAVMLDDMLERTQRRDLQDCYRPAVAACKMHDLAHAEIRAHAEPVTFLLRLCDQVQDWGRPRITPRDVRMAFALAIRDWSPGVFAMRRSTRRVKVSQERHGRGLSFRRRQPEVTLTIEMHRESPEPGVSEPAPTWAYLCEGLQRVRGEDLLDVTLRIETPGSYALQVFPLDVTEMHLLQEYVDTAAGADGVLLAEFLEEALHGPRDGGPISYEAGPSGEVDRPTERFTLRLSELERRGRPIIQRLPKGFYEAFTAWKWRQLQSLRATAILGRWPEEDAD